jgi:23S rRNA pseudouridine2605 synthase
MSESEVRLQKFLSQAGIASRRGAEAMITGGRVRVDGHLVTELGAKVDPRRSAVEVDGQRVRPAERRWVAFHKPRGYVSTRHDTHGQRTVYELLPRELQALFYVGRLDRESEGLMLFTNDGDAAHRLMHPSFRVERVYEIHLAAEPGPRERRALLEGVELEDGPARALTLRRLKPTKMGRTRIAITLLEGRKREVRRMFDSIGHPVLRLRRMRYGPIDLGDLPPGQWRELGRDEVAALERPSPAARQQAPARGRGRDRDRTERAPAGTPTGRRGPRLDERDDRPASRPPRERSDRDRSERTPAGKPPARRGPRADERDERPDRPERPRSGEGRGPGSGGGRPGPNPHGRDPRNPRRRR